MIKLKKFISAMIVFNIIALLCIILVTKFGGFNQEKEVNITSDEEVNNLIKLSGNDEIILTFKNKFLNIDNIILKFSGCEGHINGNLKIRLYDNKEEYYTYEIPLNKLYNDIFYLYTNELSELQYENIYSISIAVEDLKYNQIYLNYIEENHMNILSVNKEEHYFSNKYPIIGMSGKTIVLSQNLDIIIWLIICFNIIWILFMVLYCLFIKNKKFNNYYKTFIDKTKRIPLYNFIGLGIILISIFFTLIYSAIHKDELIQEKIYEYWTYDYVLEFTNIPIKKGDVIQEFIAGYNNLNQFILLFDNYNKEDNAIMKVQLVDKAGEIYYEWNANIGNIVGETYCLIAYPERELTKEKIYYLIISLDHPTSDITIRAVNNMQLHKSMKDLTVNDELQEQTAVYLFQQYIIYNSYSTAWWMIITTTLIAYILFMYLHKSKYLSVINIAMVFVLLSVSYFNFENLSGNIGTIPIKYALVNCIFILGIYLMFRALFTKMAYYITLLISLLVALANYYVLEFRGSEFLLSDIMSSQTALSVVGNYELVISPVVYTSILLSLCVIVLRHILDENQLVKGKKTRALIRMKYASVGTFILVFIISIITRNKDFNFFTISENFSNYGWAYTNIVLSSYSSIEKPEEYSIKYIEEIMSFVTDDNKTEALIVPKNLIVIMNESFSDLKLLGQLDTNQDYMPFINNLDKNVVKGNLHVSTFGGNTSITEYEFLTGNSQLFLPIGSIAYSSYIEDNEQSLCTTLHKQNFYNVAMHPYGGSNWNRDNVYPMLGFDEFLDLNAYEDSEIIRNYVSDKGDYNKIIEYYEGFDRDENLFIFNVTMQNHGGFDVNNGIVEKNITIDNFDSSVGENYLSLIYKSDEAFKYLLSYFSEVQEPTMIVMFGDHLPSLPDDFYKKIYNKELNERDDWEKSVQYITPYIIWTNYESSFKGISNISTNYLGSYILECAGLNMTAYDMFLLEQRKKYPVIGMLGLYNAAGEYIIYDDIKKDTLRDYQILQYMRIKDRKTSLYNDIFKRIQ